MKKMVIDLAKNLFLEHNKFLISLQKGGVKKTAGDMQKLKLNPAFEVLRTAFQVISEEAMNSLQYTSPVDAPRIAQCQAYAGFLDTLDWILSQSSDCNLLDEVFENVNLRIEGKKRAESHIIKPGSKMI